MGKTASPSALSAAEQTRLFHEGSVRSAAGAAPSYALRSQTDIILHPESLHDPAVFVQAVQDFFRGYVLKLLDPACLIRSMRQEWEQHLQLAAEKLYRENEVFRKLMTQDTVKRRTLGHSGEFLLASWIQEMLERFKAVTLSMPAWIPSDKKSKIELGAGYFLEPMDAGSVLLRQKDNGRTYSGGEIDNIIAAGEDRLFLLDYTTSMGTARRKIHTETKDAIFFTRFRQDMRSLFEESAGRRGYEDIAKIHVVSQRSDMDADVEGKEKEGIYAAMVPLTPAIVDVTDLTIREMRRRKLLVPGKKKDTFDVLVNPLRAFSAGSHRKNAAVEGAA